MPACQLTNETVAARKALAGEWHPVREVQVLEFLEERLLALSDRVPWQRRIDLHILAEGHDWSTVHSRAQDTSARVLAMVPGVEVVDLYDGFSDESPCAWRAREPSQSPWRAPET
ncbi:MAG: hypothetical protein FJ034_05910, partial [Chloroflexi bacterium]|nr:hypothetical protein [Chloroflexota bacterium]